MSTTKEALDHAIASVLGGESAGADQDPEKTADGSAADGGSKGAATADTGDPVGAAAAEGEDDAPAKDPRIAHYRAIADSRLIERDREIYRLRQQLQQQEGGAVDWKAKAKTDPRGTAEALGLTLERMIDAYAAPDGQTKDAQAAIPPEIQERLKLLDRIPDLEQRLQTVAQQRRAEARAKIDAEARSAIDAAAESAPVSAAMPSQAVELAHQIRAAWLQMYGSIPGYDQIVPLVEQGLVEQYPRVAEYAGLRKRTALQSTKGRPTAPKAQSVDALRSGAAGAGGDLTKEQRLDEIIRDVLGTAT